MEHIEQIIKNQKRLSRKQTAFVEHFIQCFNASEAARRAGYSERSARNQAHRLMTNEDLLKSIDERLEKLKVGTDDLLVRLARIARGESVDGREVTVREILKALELIGKYHSLFIQKVQHESDVNLHVIYDEGPEV